MSDSQTDSLNAASLQLSKALALVDVLGELAAGSGGVETLDKHSLSTTLYVVRDTLMGAQEAVEAAFPKKGEEPQP